MEGDEVRTPGSAAHVHNSGLDRRLLQGPVALEAVEASVAPAAPRPLNVEL